MRKLYLTPPATSEERQCRTVRQPPDLEWLAAFNAALLTMTDPYNWEQVNDTDLTVDAAIAVVEVVLAEYFATLDCGDNGECLLPTGQPVMRLGANGHYEQLVGGEWVSPVGDYAVPAVPTRSEGTAVDRKCAAAANAANVLKLLYETVTDAVADDLTEAEIIGLMVATLVSGIGLWLGLAVEALIWLTYALFVAFIEIAQFMTIDLWDEAFNDKLLCTLLACTTDTASVVTFDFDCVNEDLAANVNLAGVGALNQLRLFGQVSFMLSIIGADGLDAAGATTAVASPNCDVCGTWCQEWILTAGDINGWTQVSGAQATISTFVGRDFTSANVRYIQCEYLWNGIGAGANAASAIWKDNPPTTPNRIRLILNPLGINILFVDWHGDLTMTECSMGVNGHSGACQLTIRRIVMGGDGANPFGDTNCAFE